MGAVDLGRMLFGRLGASRRFLLVGLMGVLMTAVVVAQVRAETPTPTPGPTATPTPTAAPSPCPPSIASVSPPEGFVGRNITITGACFGGNGRVMLGETSLYVVRWTEVEVVAHIGPEVKPGAADLRVVTDWGAEARVSYRVLNYNLPGPDEEIVPGFVDIQVRPGVDAAAVSLRHGGGAPEQLFAGSDDPVLSRWWRVPVPVGHELEKVVEFAADPDVEWAEPGIVVRAAPVTPTPTAVPTSRITIRFVHDGQPVTLVAVNYGVGADGVGCRGPVAQWEGSVYSQIWPLPASFYAGGLEQPPECSKGPPTTVRFMFNSGLTPTFFSSSRVLVPLTVEVLWVGSDVDVSVEVPGPPAMVLPPSGGPPAQDAGASPLFALGMVIAGLTAIFLTGGIWVLRGR